MERKANLRILWHSNAPWVPSGYGQQTALWAPLLASLGHEVIISAFYGLAGAPLAWNGIPVLPGNFPGDRYGANTLREHQRRTKSDLVITLSDVWVMDPKRLTEFPLACWMPVDCTPLSGMDATFLRESGATPVAFSRFGEAQLRQAGFSPLYVPHGIDLDVFTPSLLREKTRDLLGITGLFAIGINAANKDSFRKGMSEQFGAFARLHARHEDTILLIHGIISEPGTLDLSRLADELGIGDAVRFVDQYDYLTGQVPVEHLVNWYAALDLYSSCSLAEGFGLTILEAQACGVPVVVTDASSMPELCGGGWKVPGERFWNPVHGGWWLKPSISAIHRVYEKAYGRGPEYYAKRKAAAPFAAAYAADRLLTGYWKPALEALEAAT